MSETGETRRISHREAAMGTAVAVLEVRVGALEGLAPKVEELVSEVAGLKGAVQEQTKITKRALLGLVRTEPVETTPLPTVPTRNRAIAVGSGAAVGGGLLYAITEAVIRAIGS